MLSMDFIVIWDTLPLCSNQVIEMMVKIHLSKSWDSSLQPWNVTLSWMFTRHLLEYQATRIHERIVSDIVNSTLTSPFSYLATNTIPVETIWWRQVAEVLDNPVSDSWNHQELHTSLFKGFQGTYTLKDSITAGEVVARCLWKSIKFTAASTNKKNVGVNRKSPLRSLALLSNPDHLVLLPILPLAFYKTPISAYLYFGL